MLIHFTRSSAIIFTFYTNKTYDQSKKISSQTRFKKKKICTSYVKARLIVSFNNLVSKKRKKLIDFNSRE